MGFEERMMMQLFAGGAGTLFGGHWLKAIFLVFLLAVPILRPESIRVVSRFRRAYVLFALSIVLPGFLTSFGMLAMNGFRGSFGGPDSAMLMQLMTAAGPVLFGFSLWQGLGAVVPRFIPPKSSRPASSGPDLSTGADGPSSQQ